VRPQAGAFRRPYPLAAPPPGIPAALIYATDDEFFEPEWSRWAARELLGVEPVEMPGGHFPMLERPEEPAELLCGYA
jgi:pimeloyl-ACP methyl ester carboxylesterase